MTVAKQGYFPHTQQRGFIRHRISITDFPSAGGTTIIGTIPAGSILPQREACAAAITTTAVSGQLKIGSSGDDDFLFASAILSAGALITGGILVGAPLSADLVVYAKLSATITAATLPAAFAADVIVEFIPNNADLESTTAYDS